jgi:hypothetical protein
MCHEQPGEYECHWSVSDCFKAPPLFWQHSSCPAFAGCAAQIAPVFDLSGGLAIYVQPIDARPDLAVDEFN